jgi:hypothetical protein
MLTAFECEQPATTLLYNVTCLTGSSDWQESELDNQPQLQAALELAELQCMRRPTTAKLEELEAALFEATGRCPPVYISDRNNAW